ncbi:hypothetical protein C8R44DRAFT_880916 [Mycena epipterygia]|nr:hypothetical protein C8R44DRAFT_880916 [Mycena epipterygia]
MPSHSESLSPVTYLCLLFSSFTNRTRSSLRRPAAAPPALYSLVRDIDFPPFGTTLTGNPRAVSDSVSLCHRPRMRRHQEYKDYDYSRDLEARGALAKLLEKLVGMGKQSIRNNTILDGVNAVAGDRRASIPASILGGILGTSVASALGN